MLFASADSELFVWIIIGILLLGSLFQMWLSVNRPEVYKTMLEDQRHKREQRRQAPSKWPRLGMVVLEGAMNVSDAAECWAVASASYSRQSNGGGLWRG